MTYFPARELQGNVPRLHGTTTVGVACTDGVVFCSDTRSMLGTFFIAHRNVKKIVQIDNHLGMTIAGGVADAQNVVDIIKYHAKLYRLERKQPIPIRAAARLASNIFFGQRLFPYFADVLVGGFDAMGASVYNVDLFGSLTQDPFVSTGSGSPVAYGILEAEFRDGLSTERAIPIVVKAVNAAIKRNAGTGDGFDVTIIDANGYRELERATKDTILKQLAGRN